MSRQLKIPSIFTAVDRVTAPIRRMTASTQNFAVRTEASVARAEMAWRRMMSPLRRVTAMLGTFGLMIGAAGLVAVIGSSISVMAEFEQRHASLAGVLGTTTDKTRELQQVSKELGATTAFSASEAAQGMEFLGKAGFEQQQIIDALPATLNLAAGGQLELGRAADIASDTLSAFNLHARETTRVADVFAAAQARANTDVEQLGQAMSFAAPTAAAMGQEIEAATAAIALFSDAGIKGGRAGRAYDAVMNDLRTHHKKLGIDIFDSAGEMLNLVEIIERMEAQGITASDAMDALGRQGGRGMAILLGQGSEALRSMETGLQDVGGEARRLAEVQLDTLQGSIRLLSSAWEGFILAQDDGTGRLAGTLRAVIDVTAEILRMASGMAAATDVMTDKERRIRSMAETTIFWLKVIGWIVAAFVTFRLAIFAARLALTAYNIALGVTGALKGRLTKQIALNAVAMGAYRVATIASSAATWLAVGAMKALNVVMMANPIGLIIAGVMLLIGLVIAIVRHWDAWGAAVSLFMGPLGFVISLIMSLRRHWDAIKAAFADGGIVAGLKAIGIAILDAILQPVQQLLGLMSKLPSWLGGGVAGNFESRIAGMRAQIQGMGDDLENAAERTPGRVDVAADRAEGQEQGLRNELMHELLININDPNGRTTTETRGDRRGRPKIMLTQNTAAFAR